MLRRRGGMQSGAGDEFLISCEDDNNLDFENLDLDDLMNGSTDQPGQGDAALPTPDVGKKRPAPETEHRKKRLATERTTRDSTPDSWRQGRAMAADEVGGGQTNIQVSKFSYSQFSVLPGQAANGIGSSACGGCSVKFCKLFLDPDSDFSKALPNNWGDETFWRPLVADEVRAWNARCEEAAEEIVGMDMDKCAEEAGLEMEKWVAQGQTEFVEMLCREASDPCALLITVPKSTTSSHSTGNTFTVLSRGGHAVLVDTHVAVAAFVAHPMPQAAAVLSAWICKDLLPSMKCSARQFEIFVVRGFRCKSSPIALEDPPQKRPRCQEWGLQDVTLAQGAPSFSRLLGAPWALWASR